MCLAVWVSLLGFGPCVSFCSRHCMHAIVTVQHDRLAIDSLNGQLVGGNCIVVKPDAPVAAGLCARCTVCTRCCVRMFCSGNDYVHVFCPCTVVASLALGECVVSALGMGLRLWEGLKLNLSGCTWVVDCGLGGRCPVLQGTNSCVVESWCVPAPQMLPVDTNCSHPHSGEWNLPGTRCGGALPASQPHTVG